MRCRSSSSVSPSRLCSVPANRLLISRVSALNHVVSRISALTHGQTNVSDLHGNWKRHLCLCMPSFCHTLVQLHCMLRHLNLVLLPWCPSPYIYTRSHATCRSPIIAFHLSRLPYKYKESTRHVPARPPSVPRLYHTWQQSLGTASADFGSPPRKMNPALYITPSHCIAQHGKTIRHR